MCTKLKNMYVLNMNKWEQGRVQAHVYQAYEHVLNMNKWEQG